MKGVRYTECSCCPYTSLSVNQIRQLEAWTNPSAVRVGWFLPVQCRCSFASEGAFQKIMDGIFGISAAVNNKNVRSTPNTAMRVTRTGRKRVPDIYYFKLNVPHPAKGSGSINEFKVGTTALGSRGIQSGQDAQLLKQRHGLGANSFDMGHFLPVTVAIWWFAPKNGVTFSDFKFIQSLLARSINVVYIIDNPKAAAWPRKESKMEKAKDMKGIESNSLAKAPTGLNDLIGPCLNVCPVP